MKRIFSLILTIALAVSMLAGCAHFYKSDYALMIGVATSQSGGKVSHTVAAIVIDKDYRIVSCRIDSIDINAADKDNNISIADSYSSKMELGDKYGMLTNSPYYGSSLAEWDDQAKAFESYVIGKTRDEVKAITDKDGKVTDTALTAGCTIAVSDFMKAIDKAFSSKHMVGLQTKGDITLGVSICASASQKSEGNVTYSADFGAVAIVDGKILAAIIDSKEVSSDVVEGEFSKITDKGTKLEQGDDYGMLTNSPYFGSSLGEWYEQAQAFADSAVGVDVSEIAGLATEGVAGCTIYAGGYKQALEKAAKYAR